MKIAFVVHDFLLGTGHGRYCIELACRFARTHELHVIANTFQNGLDFPFQKHFVPAWRTTALTSVLTFPGGADKIISNQHFDIVHAQGYSCPHADVVTAHICNSARYRRSPARRLRDRLFPFFVLPRERAFYRNATGSQIISVSKIIQKELQEEYGAASTVIYHGVDAKTFSPASKSPQNKWLFVGEAVKGLSQCIAALEHFPNAHLEVVSRSEISTYKSAAKNHGVLNRIAFRGPKSDLLPYYQQAGLFLYPSEYDSFGMVVAEAMACALPVIAGQNIGAAEWIMHGQNGFLCDSSDLNSITAQISHVERLSILELVKLRQSARATSLQHTWDHCAEQTMSVYDRAISSKRMKK